MDRISRRKFSRLSLQSGAALGGLIGLNACGNTAVRDGSAKDTLQWWDNSNLMSRLHEELFAENADNLGGAVEITTYGNAGMGQALQLAKQSNQLPDVHTTSGLDAPLPYLVQTGWFRPLELTDEAQENITGLELLEGIHTFEGKVYSVPQFSGRGSAALLWYHRELAEQAGLDPDSPPKTYDEFRGALRACLDSSEVGAAGAVIGLKEKGRLGPQVENLAQAAGFAGGNGQLFRTGEYAYDSDEYVMVLEFLRSLVIDKLLMAGSGQLSGVDARTRWAGGAAVFQLDGPWVPGNIAQEFPQLDGKVGFGQVLTPETAMSPATYSPPQGGMHYISAGSHNPVLANRAFGLLTSDDYQARLAAKMTQPIRDLAAVQASDATPLYKDLCKLLEGMGFRSPSPIVKNPDVSQVAAEFKAIRPGLSDLAQGYLNGDIPDARTALKKLNDDSARELERAVGAVSKKGAQVERDDYAFPNWKPGQDYAKEMYG